MKVYEIVTNKIIEELEKGNIPWQQPWKNKKPKNIDGREYSGINLLLLSTAPYSCPIWATMKQINERKGKVKKGEKAWMVIFCKPVYILPDEIEKELKERNIDPETALAEGLIDESIVEVKWTLRYYYIFNLEQTTLDIEKYWQSSGNNQTIEKAEQIVKNMPDPPEIVFKGNKAFYCLSKDKIYMPPRHLFISSEEYYSTLFHELVHSTGHEKRLKRKSITSKAHFGSKLYSLEELIAEIGSAFLCAEAGIEKTIKNQAAYIKHWLKVLKNDKRMIIFAAGKAQKAVDYVLNKKRS